MNNIDRLKSEGKVEESGGQYKTYFDIDTWGVVLSEDGNVGLLVEPMDDAAFAIEIGPLGGLRALAKYLTEVADSLE